MAPCSSQMQKQVFSQVQYMPNYNSSFAITINTDIYHLRNNESVQKLVGFVRKKKTAPRTVIKVTIQKKDPNFF